MPLIVLSDINILKKTIKRKEVEYFDVKPNRINRKTKGKKRKVKFIDKDREKMLAKQLKHKKKYEFHEEDFEDEWENC